MRNFPAAGRWKAGLAAIALALALILSAAPSATMAAGSAGAARDSSSKIGVRDGVQVQSRGNKKTRRRPSRRTKRRRANRGTSYTPGPAAQPVPPRIWVTADPPVPHPGDTVVVTVRLAPGDATGIGRHAAFKIGANPALLRYVGYRPTGRGALIVRPSTRDEGTLVVYRSSLPEGFGPAEALVELEYESLASGVDTVVLTDVKLLDGRAGDLNVEIEHGHVQVD